MKQVIKFGNGSYITFDVEKIDKVKAVNITSITLSFKGNKLIARSKSDKNDRPTCV